MRVSREMPNLDDKCPIDKQVEKGFGCPLLRELPQIIDAEKLTSLLKFGYNNALNAPWRIWGMRCR
jgi:hypothetical protein